MRLSFLLYLSFFATFLYHKSILVFLSPMKLAKNIWPQMVQSAVKMVTLKILSFSEQPGGERERERECVLSLLWLP